MAVGVARYDRVHYSVPMTETTARDLQSLMDTRDSLARLVARDAVYGHIDTVLIEKFARADRAVDEAR